MERLVVSGAQFGRLRSDLDAALAGRYTVIDISVESVHRKFPADHHMYAAGPQELESYWGVFFSLRPEKTSMVRRLFNLGVTATTAEPAVAVSSVLGVPVQDVAVWADSQRVVTAMVERVDLPEKWKRAFSRAIVTASLKESSGPEDPLPDLQPEILGVEVKKLSSGDHLHVTVGMNTHGIMVGQQAAGRLLIKFLNGIGKAGWYAVTNIASVYGLNPDGAFTQVGARMTFSCQVRELSDSALKKLLKIGVTAGLG